MGNYVELTGLRCCVSSWRRTPDTAIPARGKLTGSYINTALAVDEAQRAGYDDAIFLTQDGHVSEASAANIFLLRKGGLVTPPVTRSEEHTSELQSRQYLVCRLLLEKKTTVPLPISL